MIHPGAVNLFTNDDDLELPELHIMPQFLEFALPKKKVVPKATTYVPKKKNRNEELF